MINQIYKKNENGETVLVEEISVEETLDVQPNWLGFEQELAYTSLFLKAVEQAEPNKFTVLTSTLQNGKRGEASENFLLGILSSLGVTWTQSEVQELNGYLEKYNFKIRIS